MRRVGPFLLVALFFLLILLLCQAQRVQGAQYANTMEDEEPWIVISEPSVPLYEGFFPRDWAVDWGVNHHQNHTQNLSVAWIVNSTLEEHFSELNGSMEVAPGGWGHSAIAFTYNGSELNHTFWFDISIDDWNGEPFNRANYSFPLHIESEILRLDVNITKLNDIEPVEFEGMPYYDNNILELNVTNEHDALSVVLTLDSYHSEKGFHALFFCYPYSYGRFEIEPGETKRCDIRFSSDFSYLSYHRVDYPKILEFEMNMSFAIQPVDESYADHIEFFNESVTLRNLPYAAPFWKEYHSSVELERGELKWLEIDFRVIGNVPERLNLEVFDFGRLAENNVEIKLEQYSFDCQPLQDNTIRVGLHYTGGFDAQDFRISLKLESKNFRSNQASHEIYITFSKAAEQPSLCHLGIGLLILLSIVLYTQFFQGRGDGKKRID